jgi:DUF1707 SHOCT-like domain
MSRDPADAPELRVSDADREHVVTTLREHAVAGRLTSDELSERIGEAYAARTRAELTRVARDLPTSAPAADARERALARALARYVREGWRVESQSGYTAVLVKGHRRNHALHGVLTLLTGVWGLVWLVLALSGGERRALLEAEDDGRVFFERVR